MNKNKIFYPAVGMFAVLLLMFGSNAFSLIGYVLIPLLATGLVISISKINEITKSRNSLQSKVYFSFIFSFLVFSLIIFFWFIGRNVFLDAWGIASIALAVVTSTVFLISLILGIILSIKRKYSSEYDYNIKPIILLSSISVVIILILFFYNHAVSAFSKASKNENLCSLILSVSSNSAMFHKGYKDGCFRAMATLKLDVSICKKIRDSSSQTGCYIEVAYASDDVSICKKGIDEGIQNMNLCVARFTHRLKSSLMYAPLEVRKASMDSLLYMIGIQSVEFRNEDLRQILRLIENQPDLSSYTEQVKQQLSAQSDITPERPTVPTVNL